tara:strand:+ start:541 stop:1239 length:699 start_codon:yes stop_codon:yes gene_type:complete
MAIQSINIGNIANDGTGDDLREAFIKVNNNFTELNTSVTSVNLQAENLGAGTGLFAQKSDNTLQFKTLQAGAGVTITPGGNTVSITADSGLTQLILISDDGSIILPGGGQSVNLQGGTNVQTKVESGNLKINVTGSGLVELDTSPKLGGNLDADGNNITNGGTVTASNFNGALEGLVYGIDIRNISSSLIDFDMGGVELTATNVMDFIILTTDYDMGTYASPQAVSIEGGTI